MLQADILLKIRTVPDTARAAAPADSLAVQLASVGNDAASAEDGCEEFFLSKLTPAQLRPGTSFVVTDGQTYFVKIGRTGKHTVNEGEILRRLHNDVQLCHHVPQLLGSCFTSAPGHSNLGVLVMEHAGQRLTDEQWQDPQVVAEVCTALVQFHMRGFVHGDPKPEHVFLKDGRVIWSDWDAEALLTDAGANIAEGDVLPLSVHLSNLPNDHFWGRKTGTNSWAAISQHLGYGPSMLADAQALGYCVAHFLSPEGLPWRNPEIAYHPDLAGEVKALSAMGYGVSLDCGLRLLWSNPANLPDMWEHLWRAVYDVELCLRTEDELQGVANFLATIIEAGTQASEAFKEMTKGLGQPYCHAPAPFQRSRTCLEQTMEGAGQCSGHYGQRSADAARNGEALICSLLQQRVPGKLFAAHNSPRLPAYQYWGMPMPAEVGVVEKGVSCDATFGKPGEQVPHFNKEQECTLQSVGMAALVKPSPRNGGPDLLPEDRSELIGEVLFTRDIRYAEQTFEQLGAALFRAGITHPFI
ncbi:hypothetical protein WJX72_001781 [[Myrmecia] bisecta]|uniref:Protein kinase domain-containing protein n=1 Tax=[Myrmecia] bisecta TaxID=41462 RepID=A0AAW1P395_9CHLO